VVAATHGHDAVDAAVQRDDAMDTQRYNAVDPQRSDAMETAARWRDADWYMASAAGWHDTVNTQWRYAMDAAAVGAVVAPPP